MTTTPKAKNTQLDHEKKSSGHAAPAPAAAHGKKAHGRRDEVAAAEVPEHIEVVGDRNPRDTKDDKK